MNAFDRLPQRPHRLRSTASAAAALVVASAPSATLFDWNGPQPATGHFSGYWSVPGNFTPSSYGGARDLYRLGVKGEAYTVLEDIALSHLDIEIDATATLKGMHDWTDVNATWNGGLYDRDTQGLTLNGGSLNFVGSSATIQGLSLNGSLTSFGTTAVTLKGLITGFGAGAAVGGDSGGHIYLGGDGTITGLFRRLDITLAGDYNHPQYLSDVTTTGHASFTNGFAFLKGSNTLGSDTQISGSILYVNDGASLNVAAGGILSGNGQVRPTGGNGSGTVAGTVRAGGGTLSWNAGNASGAGMLTADSGSNLVLGGTFTGTGQGAVVGPDAGGTVTLGGDATLSGIFRRLDVTLAGDYNHPQVLSGVTTMGATSFTGGFAYLKGTNAFEGESSIAGSRLLVNDGASLSIATGASFSGYGIVQPATANGGGGVVSGTVRARAGNLSWSVGNGSGDGTLTADANTTLTLGGTFTGTGVGAVVGPDQGGTVVLGGDSTLAGLFRRLDITLSGDYNHPQSLSGVTTTGAASLTGGFAYLNGSNTLGGTTAIAGSRLLLNAGASLNVASGAILSGYGQVQPAGVTGGGVVAGTLRAKGGDLNWNEPQSSGDGTLTASTGGNLVLQGRFTGTGQGAVVGPDAGGAVDLGGDGTLSGVFRRLDVTLAGDYNHPQVLSDVSTSGQAGFTNGFAYLKGSSTLGGATTISGSILYVNDGATLNVAEGASLSGSGKVQPASANGGGGMVSGTVRARGGDLYWSVGSGTGAGALTADPGHTLTLGGVFTGTGAGAVVGPDAGGSVILGGDATLSGLFRRLDVTLAGDYNHPQSLANVTSTGAAGFTNGFAYLKGSNDLAGTTTLQGSVLYVGDGASLNVPSAGTLLGYGQVRPATTTGGGLLDGTLKASGGDLYWNVPNGSGSGTLTAASGSNLVIQGRFTGSGSGAVVGSDAGGTVYLGGDGTLAGVFRRLDLTLAGDYNHPQTLAGVTTSGSASFTNGFANLMGANTLGGTTTISGSILYVNDGASLDVAAGGTLSGNGTVKRNTANASSTIDGSVSVSSGTLEFDPQRITNNGLLSAKSGATLNLGGVVTQNAGQISADGTVAFVQGAMVNGGSIQGNGLITGNLTNAGGILAPGHSAGTLTLNGNYVQGGAATYAEQIGGTGTSLFDRFVVNGRASLGGSLDISLLNGFSTTVGDTFRILTATSGVTGTYSGGYDPTAWRVVYGSTYVDLVNLRAVPEPAPFAALGLGALVLLRRRRRG